LRTRRAGYGSAVRNRYLDLLRAAAIGRVIVYHLFGWPWLTIVLPAMGVMFALAGSLMAASLDARGPTKVVTSRLRRLLPPLWLFGLIAVPLMLLGGWAHETGDHPLSWPTLAFWVLPIGDPPGSERGIDLWEPLWYLRAYLWFIVLSPGLYSAYRRIGWAAVAAPIVLLAVLDKTGFSLPDVADTALWDFAAYGACWIAGFAHHDGRLGRTRPAVIVTAVAVLGATAMYWLQGHPGEDGFDLNDVPESQALWSLAFVLVVLRWQPSMGWLDRVRPVEKAVTLLNARAVTVYLWHNVMIAVAWPLLAYLTLDDLGLLNGPVTLVTVLGLTAVTIVLFGWVEDLAARRRPRLWPTTSKRPTADPRPTVPALSEPASADPAATGSAATDFRPTVAVAVGGGPSHVVPVQGGAVQGGALYGAAVLEPPVDPWAAGTAGHHGVPVGAVGAAETADSPEDPDPTPITPFHVPIELDGWGRPESPGRPDGPTEVAEHDHRASVGWLSPAQGGAAPTTVPPPEPTRSGPGVPGVPARGQSVPGQGLPGQGVPAVVSGRTRHGWSSGRGDDGGPGTDA
jgi:peptidoglycan/LPS O-acetylase OafA/YrhL